MKKVIIGILVLFMLLVICRNIYAVTPTLDEIVNKFNNCNIVKDYANKGSTWNAKSDGNKLIISALTNNRTMRAEYILEDTILNANFSGEDEVNGVGGLVFTIVLADCIGQLHGYSEGDVFATLNSEKISNYTVQNEGFEIKEISDNNYQIKIDISKKMPLIDLSNVYIEASDLQDYKKYIEGDGFAEKSKGNVWFNKSGSDGENILLVAEKNNITENTYKSILSIIEVMFASNKATDYFKTNYPNMSVGNKEFAGFKIEINPTKTEREEDLIPEYMGYKFVRITINKSEASNAFTNSNNTTETENNENKAVNNENKVENKVDNENKTANNTNNVANITVMPRTGKQQNPFLIILYIIITFAIIGMFTLIATRKKA